MAKYIIAMQQREDAAGWIVVPGAGTAKWMGKWRRVGILSGGRIHAMHHGGTAIPVLHGRCTKLGDRDASLPPSWLLSVVMVKHSG